MNYDKIGEFIALKRKEKNLTQAGLAKRLGVTDKAVSKWERGLGCPDISILEVLANELDISILELLKGRKIENEVIKVTEANDYIKDTFKVSKHIFNEELKKILNIIIIFLSLCLTGIIICFNVSSYIRVTKKEGIIFIGSYQEEDILNSELSFYEARDRLKKYIDIIEKNNGNLSHGEHKYMLNFLKAKYKLYSKSFLFNIDKVKYYSFNDIFVNIINDYNTYESGDLSRHVNFLHIYEKYVSDTSLSVREFSSDYKYRIDSEARFEEIYNSKFQNQLFFKIDDDGFNDNMVFLLLHAFDAHMNELANILRMTEEIMEAVNIYE